MSKFTAETFCKFVDKLFHPKTEDMPVEDGEDFGDLGEGIFAKASSGYGNSLDNVFVLQYLPLSLFNRPSFRHLADDPTLAVRLRHLKTIYNGVSAYYGMVSPELVKATKLRSLGFLINLGGLSRQQYDEEIFPQYERLVRKIDIHSISKDWDLFEIKNPIRLIRNYRDIPVMVAEVSYAHNCPVKFFLTAISF